MLIVYLGLNHFHSLVAHLDNDSINVHQTFCFNLVQHIIQSDVGTSTSNSSTEKDAHNYDSIITTAEEADTNLQCTMSGPDEGTW